MFREQHALEDSLAATPIKAHTQPSFGDFQLLLQRMPNPSAAFLSRNRCHAAIDETILVLHEAVENAGLLADHVAPHARQRRKGDLSGRFDRP
jgi:hypothetical protein